jgi:hypothetical protein
MSLNNLILCWRTGDDYYFRLLFTEPPFKIIKNTQGFLRDGYFPNHGSFFNIPTGYESLRSTKILGIYLFKINILSVSSSLSIRGDPSVFYRSLVLTSDGLNDTIFYNTPSVRVQNF